MRYTLIISLLLLHLLPGFAHIQLPPVISSGMVLQQKSKVAFWGYTTPGGDVAISAEWLNKEIRVKADIQGRFQTFLKTPQAGGPYRITVRKGDNQLTLEDVLIGEVWFSSGQSNMEWTLKRDMNARRELANADYPQIRLFNIPRKIAYDPLDGREGEGRWEKCDSTSASRFSAISYFFARELYHVLKVPVGMISASWGGTPAEAWTEPEQMKTSPKLAGVYDRWQKWETDFLTDSAEYAQKMHLFAGTGKKPEEPQSVYMLKRPHRKPSALYNGMVSPIVPYTIKGVVWYQGTSNRTWAEEYFDQLQALLGGWRNVWNQKDLPFLLLQISPFNYSDAHKGSLIRENQLRVLSLRRTWICPTMDLGMLEDIHPPHKYPFGKRFANMALHNLYGRKEYPVSGPLYKGYSKQKEKIIIRFDYAQSLHFKGDKLNDIMIAGEDRIFVPAQAVVKENKLIVWSDEVQNPVSVRYAWENTVRANLFNAFDLPASSFRTDHW